MAESTLVDEWWDDSKLVEGPPLVYDDERIRAFDALIDRLDASGRAPAIEYRLPFPKYEFLCYLADRRGFVLHGSNNGRIESFEPRSQTDAAGRHVKCVFATPDGILPMYYAIIKRSRYRGSLRNWLERRAGDDGEARTVYRFSVNREWLARSPWRRGTVYILPGDSFLQTIGRDGKATEEWTSERPVRPVAKIGIEPSDFPFLDRVEGHDDTVPMRIEDLQVRLVTKFDGIERDGDDWIIRFKQRRGVVELVAELVPLVSQTGVLTDVTLAVADDLDVPAIRLSGPGAEGLGESVLRFAGKLRWGLRIPLAPQALVLMWRLWRR